MHRASQYRDIISAGVRRCGPKLEATSKNEEVALAAWRDGWQAGQQAQPACLPSLRAVDVLSGSN